MTIIVITNENYKKKRRRKKVEGIGGCQTIVNRFKTSDGSARLARIFLPAQQPIFRRYKYATQHIPKLAQIPG